MSRNDGRIEELERRARDAATLEEGQRLAHDAQRLRDGREPLRRRGMRLGSPLLRN